MVNFQYFMHIYRHYTGYMYLHFLEYHSAYICFLLYRSMIYLYMYVYATTRVKFTVKYHLLQNFEIMQMKKKEFSVNDPSLHRHIISNVLSIVG